MKYIYYAKICVDKSGFTNQLFSLITAIITAHKANKKVVIVDKFLNDYSENSYSNISTILDITKINEYLKKTYDIIILDRYNINFKIISMEYGSKPNTIDITEEIVNKCYTPNKLYISNKINLNSLKGDPMPNKGKNLYIKFFINDYVFEEEHQEWCAYLINNIIFDLIDDNFIHRFQWINYLDRDMFDNILKNITHNKYFLQLANNFINKLNTTNKINVIHLRIEPDAITHWAKQNKMNEIIFEQYINNKYIDIITKYVGINDENILLSYCVNNKVVDYLKLNNYKYHFINKQLYMGREVNAIVDSIIAENCNNIFIGNFNMQKLNGSTFSYLISQKLNQNVKQILIDLDRVENDEVVL